VAVLRGIDVVIALKVAAHPDVRGPFDRLREFADSLRRHQSNPEGDRLPRTYDSLARSLTISSQTAHQGIRTLASARLFDLQTGTVVRQNLAEFLIHGVKYCFPPIRGEITRGIPTSYAGSPLASRFPQGDAPPPVWPRSNGMVKGMSFEPLHKVVPIAALADPALSELLVLVDAVRDGQARVAAIAIEELKQRLAQS